MPWICAVNSTCLLNAYYLYWKSHTQSIRKPTTSNYERNLPLLVYVEDAKISVYVETPHLFNIFFWECRVIHKKLCTAFLSCYSFLRLWSRAYKLGINGLIPFLPIFRYADTNIDPIMILQINSQWVCYHPHDRTIQTHFKSLSNVSGKSMPRYVHPERSPFRRNHTFQFVTLWVAV